MNETRLRVKVKDTGDLEETEEIIRKLRLTAYNNLHQQEMMEQELAIVWLIFGGVGLFVLLVASISIVVAMTMSTYQRRRQIGIMKVLVNSRQIRNMFLVESILLGIIGGLCGILLSYWVIWAINMTVIHMSNSGDEILFIRSSVLVAGFLMAALTGALSGIYPAIRASRTDALTAIKRE